MTAETITRDPWETDDAPVTRVLAAVLRCALAWVPEARIVGNVRAGDIARAVTAALDEPSRLSAARAEGVREGLEKAAKLVDEQYPLMNHLVGGRVSISGAIRALAPAPAEAPTTPTEASDGWVEWRGGECPVPPRTPVEAKLRSGVRQCSVDADRLRWNHPGWPGDIIAYRIVQPAEASAPAAEDDRIRAMNAEVQDYMVACGQHAEARRVAEERIAALEAENEKLRERGALVVQALDGPGANAQLLVSAVDGLRALLQGQGGADV